MITRFKTSFNSKEIAKNATSSSGLIQMTKIERHLSHFFDVFDTIDRIWARSSMHFLMKFFLNFHNDTRFFKMEQNSHISERNKIAYFHRPKVGKLIALKTIFETDYFVSFQNLLFLRIHPSKSVCEKKSSNTCR